MVSDNACHVNMQNLVTLNRSNAIVISDICLTQFTFLSNKELNGNNLCHVLHMSSTFRCRDMSNKSFVYFKMIKLGHICIWIVRYQIYKQANFPLPYVIYICIYFLCASTVVAYSFSKALFYYKSIFMSRKIGWLWYFLVVWWIKDSCLIEVHVSQNR